MVTGATIITASDKQGGEHGMAIHIELPDKSVYARQQSLHIPIESLLNRTQKLQPFAKQQKPKPSPIEKHSPTNDHWTTEQNKQTRPAQQHKSNRQTDPQLRGQQTLSKLSSSNSTKQNQQQPQVKDQKKQPEKQRCLK